MAAARHARWSPRKRNTALVILLLCAAIMTAMVAHHIHVRQTPDKNPAAGHAPSADLPQTSTTDGSFNPNISVNPILPENPVDFEALQEEFPDAVAWIRVPDTKIDYAIMQSGPGEDEDFYLTHNEDGKKKRDGSIYIQLRNDADFTDPNTVIYGHNMANGTRFRAIHDFRNKEFFNEHQYIYIYIPGHVLTYRIYSLFTYGNQHLLTTYDFESETGFQSFIDHTLNPQASTKRVRKDVTPTTADRLITLSTCTNASDRGERLLLVAVLEKDMPTR